MLEWLINLFSNPYNLSSTNNSSKTTSQTNSSNHSICSNESGFLYYYSTDRLDEIEKRELEKGVTIQNSGEPYVGNLNNNPNPIRNPLFEGGVITITPDNNNAKNSDNNHSTFFLCFCFCCCKEPDIIDPSQNYDCKNPELLAKLVGEVPAIPIIIADSEQG